MHLWKKWHLWFWKIAHRNNVGTIWVQQLWNHINKIQNRIKMMRFCNVLTADLYEKSNQKKSLNNVHEPRNAEFTAFLGSFLVEWQSNDNNIWNYYIDKYHMNLSDKAVIDLLIFFNAESSSLISGSIVNKLPIKSISME